MTIKTNQLNIALKILLISGAFGVFTLVSISSAKADTYYPITYSTTGTTVSSSSNSSDNGNSDTSSTSINSRPIVSTEAARDVSYTKALVQGTVRVITGTSTVWFEYGTRVDSLDNTTPTQTLTVGSTGASEILTNLTSNTIYYFRIVARNTHGTTFGAVKNFTTLKKAVTAAGTTSTSTTNKTSGSAGAVSSNTSTKDTAAQKASADNSQTASAINSGSGFLPRSFGGWILIVLVIFGIVVLARMIARDIEERKARQGELATA